MKKLRRLRTTLENDGFLCVGAVAIGAVSNVSVHFDSVKAPDWQNAIYAFQIGGEVVKIGVAAILVQRMHQLEKDLSQALAGHFRMGGPSPWETYEWRRRLNEYGMGELWAKRGPPNRVLALGEQRKLILKYDPCLCNDGPSGRKRPPSARVVRDVAEAKEYWKRLNCEALPPISKSR